MSCLHHMIYQSYAQRMHLFCQYPELVAQIQQTKHSESTRVLAIGKAAWKMASLCCAILREKAVSYDGYVLTKYKHSHGPIPGLAILEAGHPLSDENSLKHSATIVNWLKKIPAQEDLLVLLSGGGSALFEMLSQGATLEELVSANQSLLHSGKTIEEINLERAKMSLLKAGRALAFVKSKNIRVFAVSDVFGNDPHTICSGPFTALTQAKKTRSGWHFKQGTKSIHYNIVADNHQYCSELGMDLKHQGFKVRMDDSYYNCGINKFTEQIKAILQRAHSPRYKLKPPFLHIMGGEIPLQVKGTGQGGRCSHIALAMAGTLAKYKNTALFCFATDGNDNVPGSGGAFADTETSKALRQKGINLTKSLRAFDSNSALRSIHNILPAPILASNVNDVFILSVGYDFENPLSNRSCSDPDIFDGLFG